MFYLIDKPQNYTSRDVVNVVLKKVNIKKGGHSGTLDPFATGLMIIGTDKDTKYLDRFLLSKKTYEGKILFGKTTDTLDIEGHVIEELEDFEIDAMKIQKIVNEFFIGKISQIPPQYSAKKINGKKSYQLARSNIEVDLKPDKKQVYDFIIKETEDLKIFSFKVTVSSGTYIRSLARDIGLKLEIPAMLIELRRTKIGTISIKEAQSPLNDELFSTPIENLLNLNIYTIDDLLIKLILEGKRVNLKKEQINDDEAILINADHSIEILVSNVGAFTFKIVKKIK